MSTPRFPPLLAARLPVALVATLSVAAGCVPVTETADPGQEVALDFKLAETRRLYTLQDELAVDSLLARADHPAPEVRYQVALAFGSIVSDSAVGPLTRLLIDPIDDIRAAAAYALGQQGEAAAAAVPELTQAFDFRDTLGVYAEANAAILEAVGKLGDSTDVALLAGVSTYRPGDTLLALGQMHGLYRAMLRGIVPVRALRVAHERATDTRWPRPVRLLAAHYLQRTREPLGRFGESLLDRLRRERDPYLRMPLARALAKAPSPEMAAALASLLRREPDELVRVELVRALGDQGYENARAGLLEALADASPHVRETAADQLARQGASTDAGRYWRLAKDSLDGIAAARLYGAALRHMPIGLQEYRRYINYELRRDFEEASDPYARAAILHALAEAPWNYRYLVERALDPALGTVERTAAAEAVDRVARRGDLPGYFGTSLATVKRELGDYLAAVFAAGDPGQQAVAAGTLAVPALNFETEYEDLRFLRLAQAGLDLPRDTETFYAIEDALAALDPGYEARKPAPAFNHPITWDIYRSLQPQLVAEIETPRGTITIDLLEELAPATVVNFVQLVRNGFYEGKRFHRVVPAFVTQGGGPRGDGYGSLDYTIRSETPIGSRYDRPGLVGMASAGRHTEGVQFFFTHQPTPHLDGRYTVFARVTDGLEVVRALRPGDAMRVRLR